MGRVVSCFIFRVSCRIHEGAKLPRTSAWEVGRSTASQQPHRWSTTPQPAVYCYPCALLRTHKQLGTTRLAKQLRYEDDDEKPLLFYAAAGKRLPMFHAVRQLVEDTIGLVGLAEQLRHQDAKGTNVLMQSCSDPEIFTEVWALLEQTCWLDELCQAKDKNGKSWVVHAAEAGNLAVFQKLGGLDTNALFSAADSRDWSGFQYAARGRGAFSLDFLSMLCGLCFAEPAQHGLLVQQLTRESKDDDRSTLLMHSAIGGMGCYEYVCGMMREVGCATFQGDMQERLCVLLSWAAQGGDIGVLNSVAGGIKVRTNTWPSFDLCRQSPRRCAIEGGVWHGLRQHNGW